MWFLPSFLTPTFLLLGIAAIALPVLFHFFRRTPKGELPFSTLMFLRASPPRLTRRSKVENWLLLIIRGLIILFIALAFGRVFFRNTDFMTLNDLPGKRIAVLVDVSASMQRGDLWSQAKAEVAEVVKGLGPNDEAAIFIFGNENPLDPAANASRVVVGFANGESVQTEIRREILQSALDPITPGWGGTDYGSALQFAIDQLESNSESQSADQILESQIILVTDLQQGGDLRSLQSFQWPDHISVDLRQLECEQNNASVQLMQESKAAKQNEKLRVKVTNAEGSSNSQFQLNWLDEKGEPGQLASTAVVPPGDSRVLQIPVPEDAISGLELTGDESDFDNRFFIASPKPVPERILLLGDDEKARSQLMFYLKKALSFLEGKRVTILNQNTFDSNTECEIVFLVGNVDQATTSSLKAFAEKDGLVCVIATSETMEPTIKSLIHQQATVTNAKVDDYVLLSEIDFSSQMFRQFADPKFSNFTNIHFWNYRKLAIPGITPLAKFDSGDMAIGKISVGSRPIYVWATGWHPADSQFALSSKFVGVMLSMMLQKIELENLNFELGTPIPFGSFVEAKQATMTRPDGQSLSLNLEGESQFVSEIDAPGVYQIATPAQTKRIAVNLPFAESLTSPLDPELLENLGVVLGTMSAATDRVEVERQRRDKELESRQKLWRRMLIAAMVLIVLETLLSRHFTRKQIQGAADPQE